jgi:peptidoglycan/LPS O-acetylase OafA/YrhL
VFDFGPQPTTLYVPLWTVHYELVFALALAALGALLKRRWLVLAALVATLAVNVVWFWNGEEHAHLGSPHHLVRFCSAFGIGIALAVFAERVPVSNRMLLAIAAVTIPLGFTPFAALAGMILLAYAILCVGFLGGRLTAALAKLGVWSYGFYVSGFVIEQTVAALGLPGGAWTVAAVSLPLALAAGALSWRYVERPTIARTSALASALRGGRKPAPRREATLTSVARD